MALGGLGDVDVEVDAEDGVLCGETGGENRGRALWKGFLLSVWTRGSNVGSVKFTGVGVMVRRGVRERSEDEAVGVSSPLCSDSDEDDHKLGDGGGLVHAYEFGSCKLNMDAVCDNCGWCLEGEWRTVGGRHGDVCMIYSNPAVRGKICHFEKRTAPQQRSGRHYCKAAMSELEAVEEYENGAETRTAKIQSQEILVGYVSTTAL
jgi:hypothetical protein